MSFLKGKSSSAQALIQEQLKSRSATRHVNSPHAKYNSRGQLMCVVCGCPVKSAILWQSHVIKKSHIENLKNLQEKQLLLNSAAKRKASNIPSSAPAPKRSNVVPSVSPAPVKSILKIGGASRHVDSDEEDPVSKTESLHEGPSLPTEAAVKTESGDEDEPMDTTVGDDAEDPAKYYISKAEKDKDKEKAAQQPASDLPEGFFDDPVADAKARKIEYVDKDEAEWNSFMREVSAAETTSRQIIADDTEEAAKRNQILQAEEQMDYYRRVLKFDREKKERESTAAPSKAPVGDVESDGSSDEEDFKLTVDWRSKKCM